MTLCFLFFERVYFICRQTLLPSFKSSGVADFYILIRSLIQFDRFTQHRFHNHSIHPLQRFLLLFPTAGMHVYQLRIKHLGRLNNPHIFSFRGLGYNIIVVYDFNCIFYRHPCRAGMFPHHTFISPANNIFIHKRAGAVMDVYISRLCLF